MRLRLWLPLVGLCALITSSAYAWSYTVSVSGNTIIVNVSGMDNRNGQTCVGASVDVAGGGANCGIPGLSYGTATISCNRLGAHTVFVQVYDATTGGQYEYRQAPVTVSDPPPPTCPVYTFYAKNVLVLTHKYGTEDYPAGQSRDAQTELVFKPILVDPGTTMYMKVFDAKDPSTYRTSAPANNDNLDSAAGKLATSPSDTGSADLTFTVGSDPLMTVYLNTTGFAAGDNYIVKTSSDPGLISDPNFVCGPSTGCQASFPITAWKRVYLEKHQMYRSGVSIAGSASAGATQVMIQVPAGLRWSNVSLKAGDSIRLLHASRFDGLDFYPDFHFEDVVITAVDSVSGARNRRLLTLSLPLSYSYTEDTSYATALADGVSDGAGNIAAGLYGRNEQYLSNSFAPAYVQFVPVGHQGVGEIPYLPVVRRPHQIANKWFENTTINLLTMARPGNSNVKHILAGSGIPDPGTTKLVVSPYTFGETGLEHSFLPPGITQIPQPNYSWTWVGGIERAVGQHSNPYKGLDPWVFNGENIVHELAHTFNVNSIFYYGSDFGHCSKTMAGNPSLNCKMRSSSDPLHVPGQSGDGILGFHYSAEDDSEYMTMRRATEPLATPVR